MNDREYEVVRSSGNAIQRQNFIDSIDFGEYAPFVSRVIYHNRHPFLHNGPMSTTTRKKRQSPIHVYKHAFELFERFSEFECALVHHEGVHARDVFEHPEFFNLLDGSFSDFIQDLILPGYKAERSAYTATKLHIEKDPEIYSEPFIKKMEHFFRLYDC